MSESPSEQVNFSLAEKVLTLGKREKNAVRTVLLDLCELQEKGKGQTKAIIISITPDKLFSLTDFDNVMHEMGIDVSSSRKKVENDTGTTITFWPKPYKNNRGDFSRNLIASRQAANYFIASFLDYEPSPVDSSPQR